MIKMVVSSFFNTLIDKEEAISQDTMLEIDRIKNKNIIFTVNTNRSYQDVLYYNKDFPFIDYIISLNGSYVYDVINKKCIYKQKISKFDVKKIYNSFKRSKIYYYTCDKVYTKYSDILDKDVYKMEIEDIDSINIDNSNCIYSIFEKDNKNYLEIISNKCDSYKALKEINVKNKITDKEVLTILGNEADISILKNIKNSYIVKIASNNLKKEIKSNSYLEIDEILKKI